MLRAILFAPLLLVLVLFALSNPQPVHLAMWPTDVTFDLPLSVTILIAMAVALIFGALLLWVSVLGARLRARRAETQIRRLQATIAGLEARLAPPPIAVSAPPDNAVTISAQA